MCPGRACVSDVCYVESNLGSVVYGIAGEDHQPDLPRKKRLLVEPCCSWPPGHYIGSVLEVRPSAFALVSPRAPPSRGVETGRLVPSVLRDVSVDFGLLITECEFPLSRISLLLSSPLLSRPPLSCFSSTYTVEWTGADSGRFEIDLYHCGSMCMEVSNIPVTLVFRPRRTRSRRDRFFCLPARPPAHPPLPFPLLCGKRSTQLKHAQLTPR